MSVCEAIDARAACCGVGDDDDDAADAEVDAEPSLGEAGGVGYTDAKEAWCLPLRREERVSGAEGPRMAAAEEK